MIGARSDGAHPDANELNALAEQTLSMTERENVLAHLAVCTTCRDVVLTALPEIVVPEPVIGAEPHTTSVPVAAVPRPRRALLWPSLRWGMLAAGVVTAVLLARPGFEHFTNSAKNRSASAVQQPTAAEVKSQTTAEKTDVRASDPEAKPESPLLDGPNKTQANASHSPQQPTVASGSQTISGRKKANEPAPFVAENRSSSFDRPFTSGSRAAAIVRAKPALGTQAQAQNSLPGASSTQRDEMSGSSSGVLKESPRWVVEAGSLKRSVDAGLSWETVLQPANSLLCYASRGSQMWAGGRGGTLLRSTDGGANWSVVTVSVGGKSLNGDLKNISLQDPAVVVLTAIDGEQIASKDGGKTWEQK